MMSIEKIKEILEDTLSEARYKHSLGVADEAKKLAGVYHVDEEQAYIAGLVHDCAKEIPPEKSVEILREKYGVSVDSISILMPKILHGPLGACMAQKEFGLSDPVALDAISCHTTGKANMSTMAKIIYIADYIEPNRDFENVDVLRKLAYEDIDAAIITGIDYTISDLLSRGLVIHPDTVHARNDLIIKKMKEKD